jgi:hypothetical protein
MSETLIPDLQQAGGIEHKRLERSLSLHLIESPRPNVYKIGGGQNDHWVQLINHDFPICDCEDSTGYENPLCKHILFALLLKGDKRILHAVGILVSHMRDEIRELRKSQQQRAIRITPKLKKIVEEETKLTELHYEKDMNARYPTAHVYHDREHIGSVTRINNEIRFKRREPTDVQS